MAAPALQMNEGASLALAKPHCAHCFGMGSRWCRGKPRVCKCALRGVFAACFSRYRETRAMEGQRYARIRLEIVWNSATHGQAAHPCIGFGLPDVEFVADFEITARRVLDAAHHSIFVLHFLRGREWPACTRKLKISRGNFFHAVYRIEERMGAALVEAGIYPLRDYFAAVQPVSFRRGGLGRDSVRELRGLSWGPLHDCSREAYTREHTA
jgi:hypothetical protein